jgi:hypothetical protein
MNASEARKIVMNLSKDRLDYIYGKINNAIICGWVMYILTILI